MAQYQINKPIEATTSSTLTKPTAYPPPPSTTTQLTQTAHLFTSLARQRLKESLKTIHKRAADAMKAGGNEGTGLVRKKNSAPPTFKYPVPKKDGGSKCIKGGGKEDDTSDSELEILSRPKCYVSSDDDFEVLSDTEYQAEQERKKQNGLEYNIWIFCGRGTMKPYDLILSKFDNWRSWAMHCQ